MSFEKKIIEVNIYATEIRDKPGCMDPGHVQTSKTQSTDVSNGLRPHYAREIWNTAITGHFEYVFEEDSNKGSHMIIAMSSFARSSVLTYKRFPFKFLQLEEHFRKAPFRWQISVDGRSNRRNKAWFSNFSDKVTRRKWSQYSKGRRIKCTMRYLILAKS